MRLPLALVLCVAALSAPGFAQNMSDDELLKLFTTQRDAFRAAQSNGMGKTRGLTLVTIDSPAATTAAGALAPLAPADANTTTATTAGGSVSVTPEATTTATAAATTIGNAAVAETAAQPVVFGDLAPELQVNVNIRFGFDSAALTPDQKPLLTQLCNVMSKSDIQLFRIIGHTDASGTDAYNQKLSQLRAEEVRRYMVDECGIAPGRLEAMGVGEQFLADKADPKAAANRRVEFQALS